jgi:dipeptidyl aminopeptidase/acylaminoacyl peptidase
VSFPHYPAWSPDGTRLAFSALKDGVRQVFTMNRSGTDLVQVTHNDRDSLDPAYSPDGDRLLYSSNRVGAADCFTCNDLYVSGVDGSNETKLVDTGYDDVDGSWSPDGTRILFTRHVQKGPYTVMTAAADGTDVREVGPGQDPSWQPVVTTSDSDAPVPVKSAPVIGPVVHKGKVVGLKVTTPAASSASGASTSAYQWYRTTGTTRTPIATTPSYTLRAADAGRQITLDVTMSAPGYDDTTTTSNAYNVAGRFGAEPTVSHDKGRRLTSTAPTVVGPGYSLSYQWRYQYNAQKVKTLAGATGLTLTTTAAQRGKDVWLVATATKPGFPTITVASNKVTGR